MTSKELQQLGENDARLVRETQRLMDYYRLTNGDELYRTLRDLVTSERDALRVERDALRDALRSIARGCMIDPPHAMQRFDVYNQATAALAKGN